MRQLRHHVRAHKIQIAAQSLGGRQALLAVNRRIYLQLLFHRIQRISADKVCRDEMTPVMNDGQISKLLSLVLRHKPEALDLNMDEHGWVSVADLIDKLKKIKNITIDIERIIHIVETNDKKRFILN